ncbi:hypothetical protein D3C73_1185440 [compost metagenome]
MLRRFRIGAKRSPAIMQEHNFARPQLAEQLLGQPVGPELLLPIAKHGRPEHDLHLAAFGEIKQIDNSPRRTVIGAPLACNAVNNIVGTLNLLFDGRRTHQPVRLVHIIMNTDQMPFLMHPLDNVRMLLGMGSNDKEGRLRVIPLQKIQQQRRIPRVRSVIEGQRKFRAPDPPAEHAIAEDSADHSGNECIEGRDVK